LCDGWCGEVAELLVRVWTLVAVAAGGCWIVCFWFGLLPPYAGGVGDFFYHY